MDVFAPVDIGSDFLGYRIEELIGRGGMGVVYRAYDLRLKRPVALKLVAPALAADERFRARFARESELVMSLEHANVVPIYDAGDVDGRVYLAMRLVDGTDLGTLLRNEGALEPARAMAICTQVAAALDAAHERGLVHRDVKPSNVLLDGSEHVYLADFGLTRRLDDEGAVAGDDGIVGTPAYLAPEQLEGGPVDGRADVYALGCVLYECLTGVPVFPRGSRLAVAWAHLEENPPEPSQQRTGLPEAIDAVVRRALAKEPDERYSTCGALIAAAEEALGLGAPRTRRRRTLLLAAAAVLVIAAGAAVLATTLARGPRRSPPPPLLARPNELARISPATDKLTALVHVASLPVVLAGRGRRLWLYSESGRISEIDTRTKRVIRRIGGLFVPPAGCCSLYSGPVLAADASGAWFVQGGELGKPELVHVPVRGREREYPLPVTPTGVAVGDGSVWIVGHTSREDEVLRVDPADGHVTARTLFPHSARIDSIAFDLGAVLGRSAVFVLRSSPPATLYRIDPSSPRRPMMRVVADSAATRPQIIDGAVWIMVNGDYGSTLWFDPATLLRIHREHYDGTPDSEEYAWNGSLWWFEQPSGSVYRQNGENMPVKRIPVTPAGAPVSGPCVTSIRTAGAGVWVAVSHSLDDGSACPT